MIIDAVFPTQISENSSLSKKSIASFLKFIENRLEIKFVKNLSGISEDMIEPIRLGKLLMETGIITKLERVITFSDEPSMKSWSATCAGQTALQVGGSSWESDRDALFATLAEALERYIWVSQDDHFDDPRVATEKEIGKLGDHIPISHFAGFTEDQRKGKVDRHLSEDSRYLWVRGKSLITGSSVYLPAQMVSGTSPIPRYESHKEPRIRQITTNGLATWPTQTGARVAGALEVVERDAYMIMWLNQLTLPRISIAALKEHSGVIGRTIEKFDRYRLRPHVIKLLTDAPTHAIAVILEDLSGLTPRFSIGLRAHNSLENAVLKAMTEAARSRRFYRVRQRHSPPWDMTTPNLAIGHRERVDYWAVPEHSKGLEFLIQGTEVDIDSAPWENDSQEEYLQRIVEWCALKRYDCVSASLGNSSKNPTPLYIEQVVVPQLQPAYLVEWMQTFGGTRWQEVPALFGYTPRNKPFDEKPHPFS